MIDRNKFIEKYFNKKAECASNINELYKSFKHEAKLALTSCDSDRVKLTCHFWGYKLIFRGDQDYKPCFEKAKQDKKQWAQVKIKQKCLTFDGYIDEYEYIIKFYN